jgi:hypothetical protein
MGNHGPYRSSAGVVAAELIAGRRSGVVAIIEGRRPIG